MVSLFCMQKNLRVSQMVKFCHPERSEGSILVCKLDALPTRNRMTKKRKLTSFMTASFLHKKT